MRRTTSVESLAPGGRADDRFFVFATAILPYAAVTAYLFDVFYYHKNRGSNKSYEGLLSSILSVFIYLQYCVPVRSTYVRFFYHLFLWILSEIGTLAHVVYYAKANDKFHLVLYSVWAAIDFIYFVCLICCRVIYHHRGIHVHMPIEQEHLFHFISRLEVILALFIPVFVDTRFTTLTRDNIAFYILFDFFAESYHRFRGVLIKSTLYIFVVVVTASVATEWLYIAKNEHSYEVASLVTEIIAACLCYALIVMQFFPGNFTQAPIERGPRQRSFSTVSALPTKNLSVSFADTLESNHVEIGTDTDVSYF